MTLPFCLKIKLKIKGLATDGSNLYTMLVLVVQHSGGCKADVDSTSTSLLCQLHNQFPSFCSSLAVQKCKGRKKEQEKCYKGQR